MQFRGVKTFHFVQFVKKSSIFAPKIDEKIVKTTKNLLKNL